MATAPINPYGAAIINPHGTVVSTHSTTAAAPTTYIFNTDLSKGTVVGASSQMFNRISMEAVNGEPVFRFFEVDGLGKQLRATLELDSSASALELFKITSLITAVREQGRSGFLGIEPLTYIRRHNLERHFKFEAV